jgi:sugar phosphate isomerase/epimerase
MLAKAAKKFGIQMLYHNHDFEFVKVDGEYGLDIIYKTIPEELLKTQIDTCWVNVAGEDPVEYIRKYSGRAPVVHLKDFVMKGKKKPEQLYELIGIETKTEVESGENFGFRPVGYGVQDFPSILKASREAGAEWVVVEQDRPALGKTSLECAAMSREYLKKLGV